jgi:hypothetical protein
MRCAPIRHPLRSCRLHACEQKNGRGRQFGKKQWAFHGFLLEKVCLFPDLMLMGACQLRIFGTDIG